VKTLARITDHWRHGIAIDGAPDMQVHTNAVYYPKRINYDPNQGIYTQTGYLVQEAALYANWPPQRKGHRDWISDHHRQLPTIDEAIYIGHADLHYGHTITEFMPRLWAVAAIQRPGTKLLIHSFYSTEKLLSVTWFREIITSCELDIAALVKFDEPTRIKRLVVPGPAFCENTFVFSAFNKYARTIGDKLVAATDRRATELIYVSRERHPDAARRYEQERVVTQILRERGFRIAFPEEMSFTEQVALFRHGNVVVGTLGSSFHTGVFGRNAKVISISRDPPSNNFHLLDHFGENQVEYYMIARTGAEIDNDAFAFIRPEETAVEIDEICRSKANAQ
jgi:capsular polysaccharide biosynthesis protein